MREVIFRGKDERTKEWRIGSLLDFDRDSGYLYIVEPYHGASSLPVFELVHDRAHFVNPETVGQFTGLKDRNGVRIFEGDVVHVHYVTKYIDKWGKKYVVNMDEERRGWWPFASGDGCGCCEEDTVSPSDCEVIGNIHDDPALLEV